jgi:NADH dehydrogenase
VEGRDDVWALGDAALIPLVETPSDRGHQAPPTAQFAVREARALAKNVAAALEGRPGEPFVYKSKGALASLGAHCGVAEVYGVRLTGLPAWLLWRGYYLSFVPGFATKMRVAAQWLVDSVVGRSTVQTGVRQGPGTRYVRYRAGDRVFEEGNRADGFYAVVEGAFKPISTATGRPRSSLRRAMRSSVAGERRLALSTSHIQSGKMRLSGRCVLTKGDFSTMKLKYLSMPMFVSVSRSIMPW